MNHNRNLAIKGDYRYSVRNASGNDWGPGSYSADFGYTFPYSFQGTSNPLWRTLVANRVEAGTNYIAHKTTVKKATPMNGQALLYYSPSEFYTTNYSGTAMMWGYTPTSVNSADLPSVDEAARTKFYRKMADGFSAGTFLGELRETISMIRRPALALSKGVEAYTRDVAKHRNRVLRDSRAKGLSPKAAQRRYREVASGTWLEYNFGWVPLYNDIVSGLELFAKLTELPLIEPFTAFAEVKSHIPKTLVGSDGIMSINQRTFREERHRTQVRYKGAIYSQVNTDSNRLQDFKLDYGDLVVTGWQLIPWSFLVDYFVNVGDVLEATVTAQRLRYAYLCKTERIRSDYILTSEPYAASGFMQISEPGLVKVRIENTNRTVLSSVPIPSLSFKHSINATKGINMMSLAHLQAEERAFKKRNSL